MAKSLPNLLCKVLATKHNNRYIMTSMKIYKTLSILSVFIGSISLFLFFYFIIFGPFEAFDLQFSSFTAIVFNFVLSSLFFIQHSLMIRKTVREKIDRYLPKESFYSFHSICTGILLGSTVLLWQGSDFLVLSVSEPYN